MMDLPKPRFGNAERIDSLPEMFGYDRNMPKFWNLTDHFFGVIPATVPGRGGDGMNARLVFKQTVTSSFW